MTNNGLPWLLRLGWIGISGVGRVIYALWCPLMHRMGALRTGDGLSQALHGSSRALDGHSRNWDGLSPHRLSLSRLGLTLFTLITQYNNTSIHNLLPGHASHHRSTTVRINRPATGSLTRLVKEHTHKLVRTLSVMRSAPTLPPYPVTLSAAARRRPSTYDVTGRPPAFKVIEPNVPTCSSIAQGYRT